VKVLDYGCLDRFSFFQLTLSRRAEMVRLLYACPAG
jgi:hypothetical protein